MCMTKKALSSWLNGANNTCKNLVSSDFVPLPGKRGYAVNASSSTSMASTPAGAGEAGGEVVKRKNSTGTTKLTFAERQLATGIYIYIHTYIMLCVCLCVCIHICICDKTKIGYMY